MKGWNQQSVTAALDKLRERNIRVIDTTKKEQVKIKPTEMQVIKGNVPSKSNCYKIITLNGHGSLAKTKALKEYEESFMWQCGLYRDKNLTMPFEFHINVFYPSKRSDLDNSLKIVMDCLQKVKAIKNDNNCCKIVAQKFIDTYNPRIEFEIKETLK